MRGGEELAFPSSSLEALDTLWLQVGGTVCNLKCTHCFISCSPTNHAHEMMSLGDVLPYLQEAEALGVKEYYLTGGEPFLNREILEITRATLALGPTSILTNGVLVHAEVAQNLKALSDASPYSLEIRVSLEGWDASTNDPIRGEGTFPRILEGISELQMAGLNPVVTVSEALDDAGSSSGRERLLAFLRSIGLQRPRLKVMPLLRIGAEAARLRPYAEAETLGGAALSAEDLRALQCSSCRAVTSRGVYVCPILLDPGARLGSRLEEALGPFELKQGSCYTCHVEGLSCRT